MFLSWRSVRTAVGTMALTRMPSLPSSLARATVRFCTAALLMPVVMAPSCGVQAAPPETLMMRPHLRSRIGGTAWRMQRTVPRSLLSKALVPVLLGHREEAALRDVGGVVDQDVEPAELGERFLEQAFDRRRIVEVGRHADHAAVRLAFQLVDRLRVARRIEARHDDMRAFLQQLGRDGVADAAVAAGDDRDAVFEAEVHCYFLMPRHLTPQSSPGLTPAIHLYLS